MDGEVRLVEIRAHRLYRADEREGERCASCSSSDSGEEKALQRLSSPLGCAPLLFGDLGVV
jgi:hypothetical protein